MKVVTDLGTNQTAVNLYKTNRIVRRLRNWNANMAETFWICGGSLYPNQVVRFMQCTR